MEQGLANSLVSNTYGNGEGQNTKHYYAGTVPNKKRKKGVKPCKSKKKVV